MENTDEHFLFFRFEKRMHFLFFLCVALLLADGDALRWATVLNAHGRAPAMSYSAAANTRPQQPTRARKRLGTSGRCFFSARVHAALL